MTATVQNVRSRAVVMALVGSIVGSAAFVVAVNVRPEIVFEMDRDLPGRVITGVYSPETVDGHSFAWTSERALLNVQGADRRMPWVCAVRFRGARAAGQPQPEVSLVHEGQVLAQKAASNDYASLQATVPPRQQRSLRLNLVTSTTFVPGPSDPRQLGVQIDRWECAPEAGHLVMPPAQAIANAALTAAIFGTLFAFAGARAGWAAAGTLLLAVVQSVPWSIGVAPYTTYGDRTLRVAVGVALAAAAGAWLAARRQPLTSGARFALAFSAAALFLKLAMLLHPSKAVIDGLFHAHRYDDVRSGQFFFTQGLPGGVEFPYSIALYVFAAPWGSLIRDHVALLRIVVSASEAVAGLLLYWAVVRSWRDAPVAALAVVLFHLLPVSYWVIGNANLTQAFGQQAALATMSALIVWRLGPRDWIQVVALAALASIAFLSHVSTFMLLGPTMIAAAAVTWWRGHDVFVSARSIVCAVAIALAAATGLYYGRPEFFEAYRSIVATRAEQGAITGAAPTEAEALATRLEEGAIPVMSPVARVGNAIDLTGDSLSWPIVALALIGVWRVAVRGPGDRLTWTLAAWGTVGALFCVLGIILPGGFGHQRQAMEFIVRSIYAVAPVVVVLAAVGGVWAWRAVSVTRFGAVALVSLAVAAGGRLWVNWIR